MGGSAANAEGGGMSRRFLSGIVGTGVCVGIIIGVVIMSPLWVPVCVIWMILTGRSLRSVCEEANRASGL